MKRYTYLGRLVRDCDCAARIDDPLDGGGVPDVHEKNCAMRADMIDATIWAEEEAEEHRWLASIEDDSHDEEEVS